MEALICPKCRGTMRTYERSGVTVDQCEQCQGLFLDRGELERIAEAEMAFNARQSQQSPPQGYGQPGGYPPQQQGSYPPPQQGGFLGGLFAGGDHNRGRGHH